ncbi:peptidoglycan-binding protein [Streptomyces sioyaensis]|uniref:Peptidoglycan-binding protein n=1 Tax=Streptomyces sioyaensis TaxID=67364 RepID=A0A4Q1QQ63_9ACTN|nr:peptidoglycan-binding protein [Streptomyces sioyaensis]RXS56787.1 peptidoglycan-binding protein [Streptomyces sioyaensis]
MENVNTNALSRALTRTAVLAASAGLLTAGLLTGPASAAGPTAGPVAGRADTLAACAYYNGRALTVHGQRGDRVSQVQCLLANRRYLRWGDVTGYFGPKTLAAVKKFQSRHHLTANGKVDKKTWHALYYA